MAALNTLIRGGVSQNIYISVAFRSTCGVSSSAATSSGSHYVCPFYRRILLYSITFSVVIV